MGRRLLAASPCLLTELTLIFSFASAMKVELHLIQNFPPANLNRDDTGAPKDCEFGGERRARISSQCIKRSIRTSPVFERTLESRIGIRTKRSAERIAEILGTMHGRSADEADALARAALGQLLSDVDEKGRTSVLYYAAPSELADLATRVHEADMEGALQSIVEARAAINSHPEDTSKSDRNKVEKAHEDALNDLKKALKNAVKRFVDNNKGWARSVDVALFGRMLAEEPELNLEASCQVAHAISTNRVSMEYDYYTAVDDLNPDAETGAGMIGSTGFNSSCFYRYILVDVDQLARNLSESSSETESGRLAALDGLRAFINAAIAAIPTGKQNSFAAQARPALVLAVVRPDGSMPMSLVNAFERPAAPRNGHTLLETSVLQLDRHWADLNTMYGDEDTQVFLAVQPSLAENGTLQSLADAHVANVQELVSAVMRSVGGDT